MFVRPIAEFIRKRLAACLLLPGIYLGSAGLFATEARGQDLHFSQFFNSPLSTNPANTGFFPEGDYRVAVQYRNQWSRLMQVPYKTLSAYTDFQVSRNRLENGWLGAGLLMLKDEAGSGALRSTKVYGSVAYHQMLGLGSLLSFGVNAGSASKGINPSRLIFPDQYDGKFFDGGLPTSLILDNTKVNYFDMHVGMNYAYFPSEQSYFNLGFSVQHINQPKETFFKTSDSGPGFIPRRYTAFFSGIFKVSEQVIVAPNMYYSRQANASSLVLGSGLWYRLSDDGEQQLEGGLYYRVGDAVFGMAGYKIGPVKLNFSYDVTTSSLGGYSRGLGAYEVSLVFMGLYPSYGGDRRQSLCPRF